MTFPLSHPPCLVQDRGADDFIIQHYVIQPQPSPLGRVYLFGHRVLKAILKAPASKVSTLAPSISGIFQ